MRHYRPPLEVGQTDDLDLWSRATCVLDNCPEPSVVTHTPRHRHPHILTDVVREGLLPDDKCTWDSFLPPSLPVSPHSKVVRRVFPLSKSPTTVR